MRKVIPVILSFLVLPYLGHAQDLIVTTAGDSIQCKITKVEKNFIYFTFMQGEKPIRTLLPIEDVQSHRSDHFDTSLIPPVMQKAPASNFLRTRFAGGGGYRIGKIDPDLPSLAKEYLEELKTGYSLAGEIYLSKMESMGYGAMFSVFRTNNEIASLGLKDDIRILYAGPAVRAEVSSEDNFNFYTGISLGYLKYHNEGLLDGIDLDLDSATLGLMYNLGVDFYMSDAYGISLGVNVLRGQLTKIVMTSNGTSETIDLDEDSYESMNRIDFSIGIHLLLD